MRVNRDGSVITGGSVLIGDAAAPVAATIGWVGSQIDEVRLQADSEADPAPGATDANRVIDATGALVLPGIIDLHGDAFERSIMPRGGVAVDLHLALADNDAQLMAAGITTSYLSATDSWEPGLRSRDMLRRLIPALGRRRGGPSVKLHVRHERCNTSAIDELLDWLAAGTVELLSYNDHTPGGIAMVPDGVSPGQVQRAGVSTDELLAVLAAAVERRGEGYEQERRLAGAAAAVGCPTASHDPADETDLARDLDLGVAMAEFPMSVALAARYRDEGLDVVLGAPNLVRGGSHLGNLFVGDALAAGVGSVLCSDYHYPSLLQAPFVVSERYGIELGRAWGLVAANPARAAGLTDRGRLAVGARADVLVVEPPSLAPSHTPATAAATTDPARVRAVVAGGQVVYRRR